MNRKQVITKINRISIRTLLLENVVQKINETIVSEIDRLEKERSDLKTKLENTDSAEWEKIREEVLKEDFIQVEVREQLIALLGLK